MAKKAKRIKRKVINRCHEIWKEIEIWWEKRKHDLRILRLRFDQTQMFGYRFESVRGTPTDVHVRELNELREYIKRKFGVLFQTEPAKKGHGIVWKTDFSSVPA